MPTPLTFEEALAADTLDALWNAVLLARAEERSAAARRVPLNVLRQYGITLERAWAAYEREAQQDDRKHG